MVGPKTVLTTPYEGWRLRDMVTKGSVLVVDDEINLCRILGAKLTKSGYNVVAVHDGLQAVEKVRESNFDEVLLDQILPKMDGLTALAEIRCVRSALPVIVMTACENAEALEQARSHGVTAYVNKPFDLDSLVALVTNTSQSGGSLVGATLPESTVLFVKDQPATLEIQNGSGARIYSTAICHKNERTLSLLAPRSGDTIIQVPPRTAVRVGLPAKDAFYSFSSHVVESDDPAVLVLEKPSVIYRSQRRDHSRIPMRIPLSYAEYTDDEEDPEFRSGETRDLSAGGASIVVPEEVLPGEMLRIELRPKSNQDVISAVAQVLRSRPGAEVDEHGYVLGCRFTAVDEALGRLLED